MVRIWGLSAGTGKLCIFGHLGLVFIWSCFVSCHLLLLYYVICAPVQSQKEPVFVPLIPLPSLDHKKSKLKIFLSSFQLGSVVCKTVLVYGL